MPKMGTIGGVLLLGGVGYAAYMFYTGKWKLPNLMNLFSGINIPTPAPETLKETGVVGGIGDIIYNLTYPSELRERVHTEYVPAWYETERIIDQTTPPGETPQAPDPEGVFARGVSRTVAGDIHQAGIGGFVGVPGFSIINFLGELVGLNPHLPDPAFTIGAGLGAMAQQKKWIDSLPSGAAQQLAEREESEKRLAFIQTPEGILASTLTTLFPPMTFITGAFLAKDAYNVSQPVPTAPPPPPPSLSGVPIPELITPVAPPLVIPPSTIEEIISRPPSTGIDIIDKIGQGF